MTLALAGACLLLLGGIVFLFLRLNLADVSLVEQCEESRTFLRKQVYVFLWDHSKTPKPRETDSGLMPNNGLRLADLRSLEQLRSTFQGIDFFGPGNGAIGEADGSQPGYIVNPSISNGIMLGSGEKTVLLCNAPRSHYDAVKQQECVVLLLADGSTRRYVVNPHEYAEWADDFQNGEQEDEATLPSALDVH